MPARFEDVIATDEALRGVLGHPGELAMRKQIDHLDHHCLAFIKLSPFVLVGSVSGRGRVDVTPRGDAPGFTLVPDERTLVIPERPGNRRLDTLLNVVETGWVGLLFMIPGVEETLRVNGRASVIRDGALLDQGTVRGKRPLVALGVEVEECFTHCPKALLRASIWDTAGWPDSAALPSLARMLIDHAHMPDTMLTALEEDIEEDSTVNLY